MSLRKHEDRVREYLDNPSWLVYFRFAGSRPEIWQLCETEPEWFSFNEYTLVPPEYQEAFEAYRDGELQLSFDLGKHWTDWLCSYPPCWGVRPSDFRRKPPKPRKTFSFTAANSHSERMLERLADNSKLVIDFFSGEPTNGDETDPVAVKFQQKGE